MVTGPRPLASPPESSPAWLADQQLPLERENVFQAFFATDAKPAAGK